MQRNAKKIIVAVTAAVVFLTGVASAAPRIGAAATEDARAPYAHQRASLLLVEIQKESAKLAVHADSLESNSRNMQISWQNHADHLNGVREHLNAVGTHINELKSIYHAVLPWQQQAIGEVTAHAIHVASSTRAAIAYMSENENRLFVPEYREHLTTIASRSQDMRQTVNGFVNYQQAKLNLQRLENRLELGGQ